MENTNCRQAVFVAVILALVGAGCGSVTQANGASDPNPQTPMTYVDCATYCGCRPPSPTVPVTGMGECLCVTPGDGAIGANGSPACECAEWNQSAAQATGANGEPWSGMLWSPAAGCSNPPPS